MVTSGIRRSLEKSRSQCSTLWKVNMRRSSMVCRTGSRRCCVHLAVFTEHWKDTQLMSRFKHCYHMHMRMASKYGSANEVATSLRGRPRSRRWTGRPRPRTSMPRTIAIPVRNTFVHVGESSSCPPRSGSSPPRLRYVAQRVVDGSRGSLSRQGTRTHPEGHMFHVLPTQRAVSKSVLTQSADSFDVAKMACTTYTD